MSNTIKEEKIKNFVINNNCALEKQIDIKHQVACFQFTKLKKDIDNLYAVNFKMYIKKYRFYNMLVHYGINILQIERKKGNLVNFLYENMLNLEKYLEEDKEKSFYALKVNAENKEGIEEILTETGFFKDNAIYNLILFVAYKELLK